MLADHWQIKPVEAADQASTVWRKACMSSMSWPQLQESSTVKCFVGPGHQESLTNSKPKTWLTARKTDQPEWHNYGEDGPQS